MVVRRRRWLGGWCSPRHAGPQKKTARHRIPGQGSRKKKKELCVCVCARVWCARPHDDAWCLVLRGFPAHEEDFASIVIFIACPALCDVCYARIAPRATRPGGGHMLNSGRLQLLAAGRNNDDYCYYCATVLPSPRWPRAAFVHHQGGRRGQSYY